MDTEAREKIIEVIQKKKEHLNALNRKNYLKRTTEGRNKRLVAKTEKILNNNRTKAITDADIQKQIAKQNEIKNKVGRPRKTSQIIDNTSYTI